MPLVIKGSITQGLFWASAALNVFVVLLLDVIATLCGRPVVTCT